ncbi:hypothetical protein FM103_03785 [Corynebacterium xerosis]|nr:hypothetical protein FM103_03785 [Corynebacterium xerosis]
MREARPRCSRLPSRQFPGPPLAYPQTSGLCGTRRWNSSQLRPLPSPP